MPGLISYEYPEAGEARASSDVKLRTALVKLKEAINGELNNANLVAGTALANLAKESVPGEKLVKETIEDGKIKNATVEDAKLAKPVIVGSLTEIGTIGNGTGFTAEKVETGVYKITLNSELPSLGEMMVTLHFVGGFCYVEAPSKKVFVVKTYDTTTVVKNIAFGFMVKAS
jgi:hypothetical protein